jgi:hypothetical protein
MLKERPIITYLQKEEIMVLLVVMLVVLWLWVVEWQI